MATTQRTGTHGEVVHSVEDVGTLLPKAHVVVLAIPSTPATRHLVDRAFLRALTPGSHLVNVGRGDLIDTAALIDALKAGLIHAALDVVDPEPIARHASSGMTGGDPHGRRPFERRAVVGRFLIQTTQ